MAGITNSGIMGTILDS